VRSAIALSDFQPQAWTVKIPYEGFVLSLAHQAETEEGILWTRPLGEGRVIVSGFGTLFTNRALGLADNAQLLANIVGANVDRGGAVIFDDLHQGLAAGYDPDSFYKDGRLLATVGVLIMLWLAWVLGSTRLRIPAGRATVPRETELIKTTGGFLSRVLRSDAAARRLIEHFLQRIRERMPQTLTRPEPWEFLARNPRIAPDELARLKAWHADALASRRVPLDRLQNLLVRLDRQIS
jgi:hypothetical protein